MNLLLSNLPATFYGLGSDRTLKSNHVTRSILWSNAIGPMTSTGPRVFHVPTMLHSWESHSSSKILLRCLLISRVLCLCPPLVPMAFHAPVTILVPRFLKLYWGLIRPLCSILGALRVVMVLHSSLCSQDLAQLRDYKTWSRYQNLNIVLNALWTITRNPHKMA